MPQERRRITIDTAAYLPFEVTPTARALYEQDDYKYLVHYIRACPDGQIPALQFLLLRFHPLIVKLCGRYNTAMNMEWNDLINFARQKFIELIYRYNLNSSLYFRMYIATALRRALYDKVLFELRRKKLSQAVSFDGADADALLGDAAAVTYKPEEELEDVAAVAGELVRFVKTTAELSPLEKRLFALRFVQGLHLKEVCKQLDIASFNAVALQRKVRKVLQAHARKHLV